MRTLKGLFIRLAVGFAVMAAAEPAVAQTAVQRGKVIVTVADPSGAIIPGATISMVGLETATKAAPAAPLKTDTNGVATFERVVPGRYSIQAEFPGFELGLLRDVRIKTGDNKHLVILPLKQMAESVNVGADQRAAASTRPSLGQALTREQLDSLSDDPEELQRQIDELAGPNARIRVDSFEGSQLPPKAQIKSIHITRDQYAAENHFLGQIFVDIVTQPGIGPLRGGFNSNYNSSAMNSHTEFTPKKGPEQTRQFGFNLGGTIAKQKSDFSINLNGNHNYTTPSVYVYGPEGRRTETLNLRAPYKQLAFNGLLNYALTRDQTVRLVGFVGGNTRHNQGVNGNNLADRAFSTYIHNRMVGGQHVGPIGRRMFINTRIQWIHSDNTSRSVLEAPTIVINDARTTGGAQRRGGSVTSGLNLQSDLDYIRGINSWRAGVQIQGSWFRSDSDTNYLGTYVFTSPDAFVAGQPIFFTKRLGDPNIRYSNVQAGVYLQDDIRISKSLTLSPGIRYEAQTHVTDYNGFAPRFGATWSPFKSGRTTLRGGGGIFYDWLSTGTYAQTILVDGFHQRDLTISNPTYPDPGNVGNITATNRYLIGPDYVMPRNVGFNIGIDQALTPRIRVSGGYTFAKATHVARGRNINAPVNGVRPDAQFLNVIETVSDASMRNREAYISSNFSLTPPGPAANQKRINWRRLSFSGSYNWSRTRNNSDGPFSVPASGTLDTEWGPSMFRGPHSGFFSINSSAVRNLNVGFSMNVSQGGYYNITTGYDENFDQILNDRPAGVSRNSGRVPVSSVGMSARLGYTFTFGKGTSTSPTGIQIIGDRGGTVQVSQVGGTTTAGRYRVGINVSVNNLTNRNNYGGYVGTQTSPFFGLPTSSGEPRRILVSMNFGF